MTEEIIINIVGDRQVLPRRVPESGPTDEIIGQKAPHKEVEIIIIIVGDLMPPVPESGPTVEIIGQKAPAKEVEIIIIIVGDLMPPVPESGSTDEMIAEKVLIKEAAAAAA